ncbi:MAG: META domain-containing protein [Dysgonamonadaceae bacterium]|jgi:heat shock protein HslJ|nr:META domain-containing protein [Dysgonamonadaceae bacterium]
MKTLEKLILVVLALSMGTSCMDFVPPRQEPDHSHEPVLTETKWKLTGFVTNGNIKTPESDSDNRYWLLFNEDNTLEGRSSTNELSGSYEINAQTSSLRITSLGGTRAVEYPDGSFFVDSLRAVRSFELQKDTLKLYYSKTDYLLFNKPGDIVGYYGYLYAYINDTTSVTRVGEQLISNDKNLNDALKNFNVFSFKYPFPKVTDEYLRRTAAIECNCDIEALAEFLEKNFSKYFSDIEYGQGGEGHPDSNF